MRKIDRETTQKILDAADIVEVVSDFVTLKRSGANYIGLCPFHNERTPSFSVSRSRNICKCFSCGVGGSPVNFLMKLESMSYQEALRWLARKYHIEIKEREETAEERAAQMERESMLAVNQFAMEHYRHIMSDTEDGRNIGLGYFRERGINDKSIEKFQLGYALEKSDELYRAALAAGYSEKYLLSTGLCQRNERGVYDRYRGRVIYPVFALSGRVVAFGARTLRKDKNVAKYVNSPESVIYKKSREVYGLYQARNAISRKDKCILVEGYMDVISMHQAGVENVVASSGTSLTQEQIHAIHRFTRNVTVIYDSDAAGIKASLRGINMLLEQGMNVRVLSLPDGDDPDSFAQTHTNTEVEEYLAANEVDFIHFKTDILLRGAGNDPLKRAAAINDIVGSIAVIPDAITRNVYIEECARRFNLRENVISLSVDKLREQMKDEEWKKREHDRIRREEEAQRAATSASQQPQTPPAVKEEEAEGPVAVDGPIRPSDFTRPDDGTAVAQREEEDEDTFLRPFEREILRYVVRYGVLPVMDYETEDGGTGTLNVVEYIDSEMSIDAISFRTARHVVVWNAVMKLVTESWAADAAKYEETLNQERESLMAEGIEKIRSEATDLGDIHARELRLQEATDAEIKRRRSEYARYYLERRLLSDPDDDVRQLSTELAGDKYTLSKIYSKYAHVETEEERLSDLVPRALGELRHAILTTKIKAVKRRISQASAAADSDTLRDAMHELMELNALKAEFASFLGDRIVTPPHKS